MAEESVPPGDPTASRATAATAVSVAPTKTGQKSRLTLDLFHSVTKKCRVRQVQQYYESISQAAEARGCSVEEELKDRGFADFAEFNDSCPDFDLSCSLTDLAELGSGFVMYFYFLRYLIGLLLLLTLFSIPVMATYGGEDSMELWWWHDWERSGWLKSTREAPEGCDCLGAAKGSLGVFSSIDSDVEEAAYGTRCGLWDLEWCKDPAVPREQKGKWCCTSWCFAGVGCRVDTANNSAYASRYFDGKVRTTESCPQDHAEMAQVCGDFPDTAFNSTTLQIEYPFTWHIWLTPGNMGPNQSEASHILWMYLLCVLSMVPIFSGMNQHQKYVEELVDVETFQPCDFAVQVSGLPSTAVSENEIIEFFQENCRDKDGEHCEVLKVVIGWDVNKWRENTAELQQCRKKLRKLTHDDDRAAALKERIEALKNELKMADTSCLTSSGVAVVVFRFSYHQDLCLERWDNGFWARYFYREAGCWGGLCPGPPLPRWTGTGAEEQPRRLKVKRAANPGDINWVDLTKRKKTRVVTALRAHLIMFVLVIISFTISWCSNKIQQALRNKGSQSGSYTFQALSLLPAAVVSLVNVLLRIAAGYIAQTEAHLTVTDQEFAQAFMMTYAMIINTSGVIIFLNMQPREWYLRGGLVDDILYTMVMDAVITRLFFLIDFGWLRNAWTRWKLTLEKVDNLNRRIVNNYPPKTPEQDEEIEAVRDKVDRLKLAFQPCELDNPDRYARALTTFLVCVFYSPLVTLAPLVGVMGLLLQYCIDKPMLLRWHKRGKPQNEVLAQWSLRVAQYLTPLGFSIAFFIFLTPSWKDAKQVRSFAAAGIFISLLLIVAPIRLLRTMLGCWIWSWYSKSMRQSSRSMSRLHKDASEDYLHAQWMWPKEMKYHQDHFLYKKLDKKINPEMLGPTKTSVAASDIQATMSSTSARRDSVPIFDPGQRSCDVVLPNRKLTRQLSEKIKKQKLNQVSEEGPQFKYGVTFRSEETAESASAASKPLSPAKSVKRTRSDFWPAAEAEGEEEQALKDGYDAAGVQPVVFGVPSMEGSWIRPFVWEYGAEGSFRPYLADCQQYIEDSYRAYLKGDGQTLIWLETSDKRITIDFSKMTQRVAHHGGKIRKIRRREKE